MERWDSSTKIKWDNVNKDLHQQVPRYHPLHPVTLAKAHSAPARVSGAHHGEDFLELLVLNT